MEIRRSTVAQLRPTSSPVSRFRTIARYSTSIEEFPISRTIFSRQKLSTFVNDLSRNEILSGTGRWQSQLDWKLSTDWYKTKQNRQLQLGTAAGPGVYDHWTSFVKNRTSIVVVSRSTERGEERNALVRNGSISWWPTSRARNPFSKVTNP